MAGDAWNRTICSEDVASDDCAAILAMQTPLPGTSHHPGMVP